MKLVTVALLLVSVLAGAACSRSDSKPETTVPSITSVLSQTATPPADTTPTYASVDEAVCALALRADLGDLGYFLPLVRERSETLALDMMARVKRSDIIAGHRSRLETSGSTARLNFHDRGNYQVDLALIGGSWSVTRMWP